MAMKRRPGRPKTTKPQVRQFNFRLTEKEYRLIRDAAGGYPPATWARVELLKLAAKAVKGHKGGN